MPKKQKRAEKQKKEPSVAALISVVGLLLLAAPALGYFYIGEVRKGITYLIAMWLLAAIIVAIYLFGGVATAGMGSVCCLPFFLLIPLFGLLVVYDVYLMASGQPPKLPEI